MKSKRLFLLLTALTLFSFTSQAEAPKSGKSGLGHSSDKKTDKNVKKSPEAGVYKTIGGKGYDAANSIIRTSKGTFLMVGRSNSYGVGDMNMNAVLTDNSGKEIWNKNYGAEENEEAFDVIECKGGGFLFVGYSDSYGAGPDMKDVWIVRTDADGVKQWAKTYGTRESIDEGRSVTETADGGFIIAGITTSISSAKSDMLIIRVDAKGNKKWEKKIGDSMGDQAHKVISTSDGNYLVLGNTESTEGSKWDIRGIKINDKGDVLWDERYGGGDTEMGNSVRELPDGGFAIVGFSYTYAEGSHDIWVLKINKRGKKTWSKYFGGLSTDEGFDIAVTKKGDFVVAGYTDIYSPDKYGENTSDQSNNVVIAKYSSEGKEIWKKEIGGVGVQVARGIVNDGNGGFVIAGYSDEKAESKSTDMLLIKVSSSGS